VRVLLVHNFYTLPGGEDQVFHAERALLEARGHDVATYTVHNDQVGGRSRIGLGLSTIWSRETSRRLGQVMASRRPEVVHFHNTLPLISPSAYYTAHRAGAAVVQTLHNYRLICPGSLLYRNGRVCVDCVGRSLPWPGVAHRCYRGSASASGAVAAMLASHRLAGTWRRRIDRYVALTRFQKSMMEQGGLPADRISIKPNFVEDGERWSPDPSVRRRGGLFVGRLVPEKGFSTLLKAWEGIEAPLTVIGDGPMRSSLAGRPSHVEALGARSREEVAASMKGAAFLLVPSEWYEAFPLVVIEAFRAGLPVIAPRLGSLEEIVTDGVTGLLFEAGNALDLSGRIRWALSHEEKLREIGTAARAVFEERYTPEANYGMLMTIYEIAVRERATTRS
jgi:glycosyltransferase involved in cell wall biosynthesis